MTIAQAIQLLAKELGKSGFEDARFEARRLVEEVLGFSSSEILRSPATELDPAAVDRVQTALVERCKGVPLAYIVGKKGFRRHEFVVRSGVLIPRPETEFVVEVALQRATPPVNQVADFGAGSGCIGLSLLFDWPHARLFAVDTSDVAKDVIAENARRLGVLNRVTIMKMDVADLPEDRPLDVVVGNPPYIPIDDPKVEPHVKQFEPHEALYSGPDGLKHLRAWSIKAEAILRPGGLCVFEFGAGQTSTVKAIMKTAGFTKLQVTKDLAGHDRVISGVKGG